MSIEPSVHYSLSGGPVGREALEGLPQEPAFSTREYERRIKLVQEGMKAEGVDALLVFDPPHVFYLSGFQTFSVYNSECVILPANGSPLLVVDPMELGGALMHSWFGRVYGYAGDDRPKYLAQLISDEGLANSRIATETSSRALPVRTYEALKAGLPKTELVDGSTMVPKVKATKSSEEVAQLRRSASITNVGMEAAINAIEAGKTDNDVAAAAYDAMVGSGSEYMCVDPIVTTGRRSSILHSTHKRVPIEAGDTVLLEMGACVQRYTAPIMRTATVGTPSEEVRGVADACLGALDNVLSTIKAGVTGHEVAVAGWESLQHAGDDIVFHGVFGYAVGAGFPPTWSDDTGVMTLGNHEPLRAGQVFHHPVAVRKLGRFGVAFSETTVVTEEGCEVLTGVPRELFLR